MRKNIILFTLLLMLMAQGTVAQNKRQSVSCQQSLDSIALLLNTSNAECNRLRYALSGSQKSEQKLRNELSDAQESIRQLGQELSELRSNYQNLQQTSSRRINELQSRIAKLTRDYEALKDSVSGADQKTDFQQPVPMFDVSIVACPKYAKAKLLSTWDGEHDAEIIFYDATGNPVETFMGHYLYNEQEHRFTFNNETITFVGARGATSGILTVDNKSFRAKLERNYLN